MYTHYLNELIKEWFKSLMVHVCIYRAASIQKQEVVVTICLLNNVSYNQCMVCRAVFIYKQIKNAMIVMMDKLVKEWFKRLMEKPGAILKL